MRTIRELVSTTKKYKKLVVQQELKSKKNTVAYVTINDKPRVLKWFVPGLKRQMNVEYTILKKGSSKLNIPTVFEMDEKNNVLVTNYIIGENLCDILNNKDTAQTEKQRLILLLAEWFNDFHNFFKKEKDFIIRGDPSLRNFILTDRIWGVDFEEARPGKPIEDLAGMCTSILTTDPMFTKEKFNLCKLLLEHYNNLAPGRISNANNEIAYALLEKIQWRPEDEEILRKFSKKIKERGLV
jgi:tRNA A-37 threonylcarbamoyl transferase component Bud32